MGGSLIADQLFERESDVGAVAAAVERARAGDGGVVAVEGPAGIGKSRLVRLATDAAADAGFRVLVARGGEHEAEFSHGVVRQLLERPLATASADERPLLLAGPAGVAARALGLGGTGTDSGEEPASDAAFAVAHGLYWLLANLAADAPVALVVDDAHWADAPSLRFLTYLARRLEGLPVLLVFSVRSGDPGADDPGLVETLEDPRTVRLSPRPLSAAGAASLLRDVLDTAPDPEFAAACHAMTQGNPLLLRRLAEAVRDDGVAPVGAAADQVAAIGPRAVARSVLLRLGRLHPDAHALARAAAVLGPVCELRDAARVAGLPGAEAAGAADALRRIELLSGASTLEFVHPIVRTAVYEDMPVGDRAAAHARAAKALRDAAAPAGEVARHLVAAPPAGDPAVVAQLRAAATQARREGAVEIAAGLLRRAVAEPPAAADRPDVLAELADASLHAGRTDDAAEAAADAVAATEDPARRTRRRLVLARALIATEGQRAAGETLDAALRDARAAGDRELELRVEVERSTLGALDSGSMARSAERLRRHAGLAGDTPVERLVLATLAREALLAGSPATEVAALAERAVAGGRIMRDSGSETVTAHHAVLVLLVCDHLEPARAAIEVAFDDARERGSALGFAYASVSRSTLAAMTGDVASAEAHSRAAVDALADHAAYVALPVARLVWCLVERGELDEAEAELTRFGMDGALPDLFPWSRVQYARAQLHVARGAFDAARADLEEIAAREAARGLRDTELLWRPLTALVQQRLGNDEAARRLAADGIEHARTWGVPSAIGEAMRAAALVGPPDEASARLAEAIEVLRGSVAALTLARAEVDLGVALRRDGARTEAREALKAGLDRAQRCHATALAARAHEELVAAGARPRRMQFSGADSLTASEGRVASLAASGMGNREIARELFVTPKTVENHLGRVYQKLGIRSRDQLGEALGEPAAA